MADSTNIYDWSNTVNSNATADPAINWAEGQLPSTVNNAARGMMAAVAHFIKDVAGSAVTSGTANAQTLTINGTYSTLSTGRILTVKAGVGNTGAATLAVTNANGSVLATKSIIKKMASGEAALVASDIVQSAIHQFVYDASASAGNGAWTLLNPLTLGAGVGSSLAVGANTALNSGVKLQINANTAALPAPTFGGTVLHIGGVDVSAVRVYMDAFTNSVANAGSFVFRKSRGTAAARTGIVSGDFLGSFFWDGYDSTGYNGNDAAAIIGIAGETFSTTAHGTGFQFRTVPNGGLTTVTAVHFHPSGGVELGAASTDPGLGAINASGGITVFRNTAIPAGGTTGAGLKVSSTANFGVFFGSGVPTCTAGRGSIYMRSDGTTSTTRCYVNSDGGSVWTALFTVA